MNGVNKVILIGRLGQDPTMRYTAAGSAIASISIATSESWTDKQSGEKKEQTEWHKVVFFNRLAEIVGEYLTKGSMVYVEGSLTTRKWQDKDGSDRYSTEVKASSMQMLGGKPSDQPPAATGPAKGGFRDAAPEQVSDELPFDEDDIPF